LANLAVLLSFVFAILGVYQDKTKLIATAAALSSGVWILVYLWPW
jgi:hypothetical protein